MRERDFLADIFYVIVLYKHTPGSSQAMASVRRLADQVATLSVFVYDNSPHPCVEKDERIIYRHDRKNGGVAKAYNEAALIASARGKKWMLLLDQDTAFDPPFIEALYRSTVSHPGSIAFVPRLNDRRGLVSPFRWRMGRGIRIDAPAEKLSLEKFRFANSGLLIQTDVFHAIGGYEENIPIDFSDIAFAEKLRELTDHFVVVNCTLHHSLSSVEHQTAEEALSRFHHYCFGALQMGRTYGSFFLYYFWALLRGFNLSVRYRTANFLKVLLNR